MEDFVKPPFTIEQIAVISEYQRGPNPLVCTYDECDGKSLTVPRVMQISRWKLRCPYCGAEHRLLPAHVLNGEKP